MLLPVHALTHWHQLDETQLQLLAYAEVNQRGGFININPAQQHRIQPDRCQPGMLRGFYTA